MAILQTGNTTGVVGPRLSAIQPAQFGGGVQAAQDAFLSGIQGFGELERVRRSQRLSQIEEARLPFELAKAQADAEDLETLRQANLTKTAAEAATARAAQEAEEQRLLALQQGRETLPERTSLGIQTDLENKRLALIRAQSDLASTMAAGGSRLQQEEQQRRIDDLNRQIALDTAEFQRANLGERLTAQSDADLARFRATTSGDIRQDLENRYGTQETIGPGPTGNIARVRTIPVVGADGKITQRPVSSSDIRTAAEEQRIADMAKAQINYYDAGAEMRRRPKQFAPQRIRLEEADPNNPFSNVKILKGWFDGRWDPQRQRMVYTRYGADGNVVEQERDLTPQEEAALNVSSVPEALAQPIQGVAAPATAGDLGSELSGIAGGGTTAPVTPAPVVAPSAVVTPPANPNAGYIERAVTGVGNVASNVGMGINRAITGVGNVVGREVGYLDRTLPGGILGNRAIREFFAGPSQAPIAAAQTPAMAAPPQLTVSQAALAEPGYFIGAENGRTYLKDASGRITLVQ